MLYIYIYIVYIQVRETLSHHSSLAHHFLWLEPSSVLQEGQGLLVGTWRKADQHQKKPWNSGGELNSNLFFGFNPSEKWWSSSVGMMKFPIWKNVPNHQSETVSIIRPSHLDDTYECCYSFLGKDDGKNKQVCQGSGISNKMPHIFQFKLRRVHWQSIWVWLKPIRWWTLIAGHWNVEHHKYRDNTYYIYIDILYRYVMICKDIDLIDQWLFGYGTQFRRDGSFWTEARMAYFRFIPRSAVSQRSCARDLASLVVNWDSMHARVQKSGQITV